MGDPMRIRAAINGDTTEVKVLMRHDMETGLRKDAAGAFIPSRHIRSVIAKCNDRVVLEALFGVSVAKDPFLNFRFKGGAKGDKISISWADNRGDSRTDVAVIG